MNHQLPKSMYGLGGVERAILGYLAVLNDKEIMAQLTDVEAIVARASVMGSLVYLEELLNDQRERDANAHVVLMCVKMREAVNGYRDVGDPLLVTATKCCAQAVYEYYRSKKWDLEYTSVKNG